MAALISGLAYKTYVTNIATPQGEDEWADEDDDESAGTLLSDLMGSFAPASDFPGFEMGDDDIEEDDPDAFNDPIYQIDLQV